MHWRRAIEMPGILPETRASRAFPAYWHTGNSIQTIADPPSTTMV
jgi:hypothetical protein